SRPGRSGAEYLTRGSVLPPTPCCQAANGSLALNQLAVRRKRNTGGRTACRDRPPAEGERASSARPGRHEAGRARESGGDLEDEVGRVDRLAAVERDVEIEAARAADVHVGRDAGVDREIA